MTEPHRKTAAPLRLLGCLIKGPLGCLAFLIGATVVFVIFLPPACGNLVSQELEDQFARRYEGTLEVKEAWIGSLYGPQRIESIVLREPGGDEVLHANVTAPSLEGLLLERDRSWGPVEIHVPSVKLIEYADGTSNLERALAHRPGEVPGVDISFDRRSEKVSIGQLSYSRVRTMSAHATIDRLSWTSASGEELQLHAVECVAELALQREGLHMELNGRGTLRDDRPEGLRFQLSVDSLDRWSEPGATVPWTFALQLRDAPVLLLELLTARALRNPLGETVDRLDLSLSSSSTARCRVEALELRTGVAAVSGQARWDGTGETLTADDDDTIRIDFPTDSWWTSAVVQPLLPLMDDVELTSSNGRANLLLEEFSIPVSGSLLDMTAHCEIEADWVAYHLPPAVGDLLFERSAKRSAPMVLDLDGGFAHFASFPVTTEKGDLLVRGKLDLKTGTYELYVTAPDGREYAVTGPREDPEVVPVGG